MRRPSARVAEATLDLMEFLDGLRREKTWKTDLKKGLGKVAYHAACHLRAQKIAFPGVRVLNASATPRCASSSSARPSTAPGA